MPSSSTFVVSKCTIYPDQKSGIKKLGLSVSDLPMLSRQYIQKGVLLSNPPYSATQFVSLLKQSLSATLSHFPALAGCLITDSEGSYHNKLHHSPHPIGSVNICPPPIIPQSKEHFLTPTSAQDHANPIRGTSFYSGDQVHNQLADLSDESVNSTLHKQTVNASTSCHINDNNGTIIPPIKSCQEHANLIQCQTFCCGGDHVHNQQINVAVEPVNSPQDNQTGNTSASFDIEAGRDIEAIGASSNETSSSNADNETGTSPSQTENQNSLPNDDDGIDETLPNGVNRTSPNEDHNGKKEVKFVFMIGAQLIAAGIEALVSKNTANVSGAAIVLRYILIGCMFVGLTCLLYALGLSVYKPRSSVVARVVKVAARVVRVIGYAVMVITLSVATGLNLPNKLMLWVTLVVFLLFLPAIILYAMKLATEDTW